MSSILRELERALLPAHCVKCLSRIFEFLRQHDAGMIDGQVVPTELKERAYADVLRLGREAFERLGSMNPTVA